MDLAGVIPALLTPFTPQGEVDLPKIRPYIDWMVASGVDALFANGTTGEGPMMSDAQRRQTAEAVVEAAAGRLPVLLMTGAITTAETIALTRHAQQIGAAGAVVVAPWYFPLDEAALEAHFAAVAEAVPELSLYLYNIPANTRNPISPESAGRLADRYPHIRGVKDSSKELESIQRFVAALPGRSVIAGSDALLLDGLLVGGKGVASAVAAVFPDVMVAIHRAYQAGDIAEARRLQDRANQVRSLLKRGPYLHPYKLALTWRGVDLGTVCSPLRECSPAEAEALRLNLAEMGVL